MKKGSLVIRCSQCGKQVGWLIPTGRNKKTGLPTFEENIKEDVRVRHTAWGDYYLCGVCGEEMRPC